MIHISGARSITNKYYEVKYKKISDLIVSRAESGYNYCVFEEEIKDYTIVFGLKSYIESNGYLVEHDKLPNRNYKFCITW